MPTYGYRCDHCEAEFDRFQSITASPLRKCPECGKLTLRRLLGTGAGILFKGGGFYETDYRSDSYKQAAKQDKPSTDTKTSSTSKTESSQADTRKKNPKPQASSS